MNFVSMLRERLVEVKTRPQFGASSRKKGDARFPIWMDTPSSTQLPGEFDKLVKLFTIAPNKAREKLGPA
ncbi:MAG: hypothetical protein ACE5G7_00760 [Candidatus Hydrothermarchaeaceae archaeon]